MSLTRQINYVPTRCKYIYNVQDETLTIKDDDGREHTEPVTPELKRNLVRLGIPYHIVEKLTKPGKKKKRRESNGIPPGPYPQPH